jgi:hypothetical protein
VRRLAVATVLVAVLAPAAGAAREAPGARTPLLGIVGDRVLYQQLVEFDPATLRRLGGGVPLAGHRAGWSFSPDRGLLVLGRSRERCGPTTLRLVDVAQLRTLGDVPVGTGSPVTATGWLGRHRLVAVLAPSPCEGARRAQVVVLDAEARRVLATSTLDGSVLGVARAPGRLVLLLAPANRIGAARLAVVERSGELREQTLEAIPAGTTPSRLSRPGLAVDGTGARAFVVSAGDRLAEVDLRSLRVGYHELVARELAKYRRAGPIREALWLGGGLLAVTGTNVGAANGADAGAGLRLVDTRSWTFRTLDPEVSSAQLLDGRTLVAYRPNALLAYSRDGHERYRLFEGAPVGRVAAIGGRGVATVGRSTVVFDLASGAVGRTVSQPLWELLLGPAAPS